MRIGRSIPRAFDTLAARLFGGRCCLCRGASGDGLLCAPCHAELPRLPASGCARCALPLAACTPPGAQCWRCVAESPPYDATCAVYVYDFPADVLLQSLKFRGELALAHLFGAELAARVAGSAAADVDLALPVPLHRARLTERGYNHALEIARLACAGLNVRLEPAACERLRDTPPQSGLELAARRRNLRGAFACTAPVRGLRVAVVDDVMTSGATLAELAATLKAAGAVRVVNWVVARTPEPSH